MPEGLGQGSKLWHEKRFFGSGIVGIRSREEEESPHRSVSGGTEGPVSMHSDLPHEAPTSTCFHRAIFSAIWLEVGTSLLSTGLYDWRGRKIRTYHRRIRKLSQGQR